MRMYREFELLADMFEIQFVGRAWDQKMDSVRPGDCRAGQHAGGGWLSVGNLMTHRSLCIAVEGVLLTGLGMSVGNA